MTNLSLCRRPRWPGLRVRDASPCRASHACRWKASLNLQISCKTGVQLTSDATQAVEQTLTGRVKIATPTTNGVDELLFRQMFMELPSMIIAALLRNWMAVVPGAL
jgi:hypothetical protein